MFKSIACFFKGHTWQRESEIFANYAWYEGKHRDKCLRCNLVTSWVYGPR